MQCVWTYEAGSWLPVAVQPTCWLAAGSGSKEQHQKFYSFTLCKMTSKARWPPAEKRQRSD